MLFLYLYSTFYINCVHPFGTVYDVAFAKQPPDSSRHPIDSHKKTTQAGGFLMVPIV